MLAVMGQLRDLRTQRPFAHVTRALSGVIAMMLWFGALIRMPIAEAQAISFAAPILVVVLSALVLGEVVRIYRWTAVLVGFAGVLIMLSPHLSLERLWAGDAHATGAAMAFASAFFMALAMIHVRALVQTEPTGTIVLYFSILATAMAGLTLPFAWVTPTWPELGLLAMAGMMGGIGQILMTQAYRHADASVVAPLEYMSLVWVVLAGFAIFGDRPDLAMAIGAPLVIGSGIFIALRERRIKVTPDAVNAVKTP
jgi:drug/metabolite transporter (DMT)-like permease